MAKINAFLGFISVCAVAAAANARPSITAHSGCMKTPPNSIKSIEKGIESGADFVEIDLNFTDDGTPVLSHDRPKGGEELYKNALEILKKNPKIEFNLDVKSTANLKEALAMAEKAGVGGRVFFSGVKEEFVAEFKRQCPRARFYYNVYPDRRTDIDGLVRRAKEIGAIGLNLNYKSANAGIVRKCHAAGLLVSVWTVDGKKDIDRMVKLGVDAIASNNPVLARTRAAASKEVLP